MASLRSLFAIHPEPFTPILQIVHRVISASMACSRPTRSGVPRSFPPWNADPHFRGIEDPTVIAKILTHLGLLIRAPPRADSSSRTRVLEVQQYFPLWR